MARWVASLGLQPRTAGDAQAAIASLRERHADLAVIDIMMPGQNGLWLAGEIRRDHPNTAVVLATGYTELADAAAAEGRVADLLVKPFRRDRFELALDRGRQWRRQAVEEVEWHARLSQEMADRIGQVRHVLATQRALGFDEGQTLMALVEERMPDVMRHSERVKAHVIAIAELLRAAPSQFDPDIVIAFLTVLAREGETAGRPVVGPSHPTTGQSATCPRSTSIH